MIRTTSFFVLFTCSTSLAMAQAAQQAAPETPPQSPSLEHPFAKPGDLSPYLIVRQASWKPVKTLEEFGSRGE